MSCNIMVPLPEDCPPTCTASALPPPETRFFCEPNSALVGSAGRGGQGAFAGTGNAAATSTNDASLAAADVPALATGGQQDSGEMVVTQTSFQVVTVGSLTASGGSVTATSSSFSPLTSSETTETAAEPTSSTTTPPSKTSSSATTTTMSGTTETAGALTTTAKHKSFMQTTAGWVTIFTVVVFVLLIALVTACLWRRKKKLEVKKQGSGDGEANEAALRRDTGDWSAGQSVPLTSVTVAGPPYRASTAPARTGAFGSQRRPAKAEGAWETQKMMAGQGVVVKEARSIPSNNSTSRPQPAVSLAQSGSQNNPSSQAATDVPVASGADAAPRVGRLAPPRDNRFSIPSSIYSVASDQEGTSPPQEAPPIGRPAGASRTQRRIDKEREREWNENAISGEFDSEEADDRAKNEARERRLKAEADATQATQEVKDSWDYKKNMTTGPPRQKMKSSLGIGPKALRKPVELPLQKSVPDIQFHGQEQQELDAEINELMALPHPTRMEGQDYDPNAPRGSPARPMKSIRRGNGLVDVEVTEAELEQRRKWMEAGKLERKRQRDAAGRVALRQASPIQDNDTIQDERVEWGPNGPVKVGNPMKGRVEKNAIGRTPRPIVTNEEIQMHKPRVKGEPF